MTPDTMNTLLAAKREERAVVIATRLPDGVQRVHPDRDMPAGVGEACELALAGEASGLHEIGGSTWFLHVQVPAFRLIVIGAVHIAQALLTMGSSLGFAVTIVDPRRPFNSEERFSAASRIHDWPDVAISRLRPDRRTAVVALSHDPKLDDPGLDVALHSGALYVGALGSRKSHAARLQRLARLGHGEDALSRVRGPVGLAIGGVSPAEVALSILAELVAVRRGSPLGQRG